MKYKNKNENNKKKKRRRKVNTVTVPKLFKTPKFPMEWVFFTLIQFNSLVRIGVF